MKFINCSTFYEYTFINNCVLQNIPDIYDFHRSSEACKDEPEEITTGRKRKKPAAKTGKTKKRKESFEPDILDTTWIHPESYQAAEKHVFFYPVFVPCLSIWLSK